jgi:hypothetical protein
MTADDYTQDCQNRKAEYSVGADFHNSPPVAAHTKAATNMHQIVKMFNNLNTGTSLDIGLIGCQELSAVLCLMFG